ncbi:MAG: hypothetical protein ACYC64_14275 [Armatimonadota bacterium]
MKITKIAVLAVVLLLTISVAASATGRYQLKLLNNSAYYPPYNGTIWTSSSHSEGVAIGPVYIQIYDTLSHTTSYTNMLCVDLLGTINWNQTWYADIAYGTPTTVLNSTAWDRAVYMAQNHTEWTTLGTTGNSAELKKQKSAMQVAVWETIRDGDNWNINHVAGMGGFALGNIWGDDTSGTIRSGIAATAKGYYDDAVAHATADYGASHGYYLADSADTQDLMFFVPNYGPPPSGDTPTVPEVPSMLLGSVGLTLIGAIRRKISKG